MTFRFFVTYDVTTPESAEHGDYAETGYATPGGWHFEEPSPLRLSEAIDMLGCLDSGSDGFSYYEADGRQDYRTGAETRYAFHVPRNATPSSVARINRALRARHLI